MPSVTIDGTLVSSNSDAYVIAEIGHNHQGSVDICKLMIRKAKEAGCNAVKLQKRDNKTLYSKEFYDSPYNSENAFGSTYGEHREALEFNAEEYRELNDYARSLGITLFATGFDIRSADFLRELDFPALKIASGSITDVALLKHVARTWDKPIILSTGGAFVEQIVNAHGLLAEGNSDICILQCTSGYPAAYDELDLKVIETYRRWFPELVIGWSGHDTGIAMALVAYALGARIIEKHFTLDRAMKGTDQAFSLEPQGMAAMVDNLRKARLAMGTGQKVVHPSELEPLKKQLKNKDGFVDGQTSPSFPYAD